MAKWDVIVAGAGIAGLSAAAVLSLRGYKVKVVDPFYPYNSSASSMSAGIVVSSMPGILGSMARVSLEAYKKFRLVLSSGALYIYPDKECAGLSRRIIESNGFKWQMLGVDDAEDLVGTSMLVRDNEIVALVEEYVVDAGSFLSRLHSIILDTGGVIEKGRLSDSSSAVKIVAAGPWTAEMIRDIRDRVIVYRCQAQVLTEPLSKITLEDETLGFYLARHPGEAIIGDGSNAILHDINDGFKSDMEDAYKILEKLAERIPEAAYTGIKRVWSAPCIVGLDGNPLIGPVSGDMYIMTGFNGAGITLAWGAAVLLADIIEGKRVTPKELDPGREMPEVNVRSRPREPYDLC